MFIKSYPEMVEIIADIKEEGNNKRAYRFLKGTDCKNGEFTMAHSVEEFAEANFVQIITLKNPVDDNIDELTIEDIEKDELYEITNN